MIPATAQPNPILMAHRGGNEVAVENSTEAFRSLRKIGVRHVETDVHLTADGVVVISHDETIDRIYDGEGTIAEYTYEELLQFPDVQGNHIPRLKDVLEEFPDFYFNIDAKTDSVSEPMLDVIKECDAFERTLIASFSERRLERMRESVGPKVSFSLGAKAVVRLMMAAHTVSDAEVWRVPGPQQGVRAVQVPEKYGGLRIVTPRFISTAHAAGLAVHVWTVNDLDRMVVLLQMGIDGIITDKPASAQRLLESFKSRDSS